MNGNNQAEEDRQQQEYARQLALDRTKGSQANGGGMAGGIAGQMSKKKNFNKIEKALGKKGKKIKAKEHSSAVWIIAIIIALVKDLLDVGTIELASGVDWIVDIIIGVIFFFLFGKSIKLTRRLAVTILTVIAEAIPISGFMWWWTLSVVYLYFKSQHQSES
ncbi:MAG: hypothetical protein ABIJ60_02475 [Patescibacteria group bacterium]